MKLTKNFSSNEFISGYKLSDLNSYQIRLMTILATELQKVRDYINSSSLPNAGKISMVVNSGYRTLDDYDRLLKAGYNPSKNSDHFFGNVQGTSPTIGAADIRFKGTTASVKDIYKLIVKGCKEGLFEFGQIIEEKDSWIHFGNSPQLIFSNKMRGSIHRKKFLTSPDGIQYLTYIE